MNEAAQPKGKMGQHTDMMPGCAAAFQNINDNLQRIADDMREMRGEFRALDAGVRNGITTRLSQAETELRILKETKAVADKIEGEIAGEQKAFKSKWEGAVINLVVAGVGAVILFVMQLYFVNQEKKSEARIQDLRSLIMNIEKK